nr:MAG TPA: hypothetical protein [Caudoviricetes sp.]
MLSECEALIVKNRIHVMSGSESWRNLWYLLFLRSISAYYI